MCGIIGLYAPGEKVAHLTYLGLFALQHRGQESAGIAVSDGETITVVKDMGLVTTVFDERKLAPLEGHIAVGHVRYSTRGTSTWQNAQPLYRSAGDHSFIISHNGNLTNTNKLEEILGMLPGLELRESPGIDSTSDSDLMAELITHYMPPADQPEGDRDLENAISEVLPQLEGAFSVIFSDEQHLIGVRDPLGFHPLVLGRLDNGWALASETSALNLMGAHFVRDIEPGEIVVIDSNGVHSRRYAQPKPKLCVFEFVYFARPDSQLYNQSVHAVRQRMGEELARQAPAQADMVMPVPESGVPAAQGYARELGIPYGDGVVKNRYIGRTFISPSQKQRGMGVKMKLNPIRENIEGKSLVVIDDSIVRGTTTKAVIAMLREAGAREIHFRVSSPPYRWPCFFGIDTGSRSELIAASMSVGEICEYIGADSLAFLEADAMIRATDASTNAFCTACLTGQYPINIDSEFDLELPEQQDDGYVFIPIDEETIFVSNKDL